MYSSVFQRPEGIQRFYWTCPPALILGLLLGFIMPWPLGSLWTSLIMLTGVVIALLLNRSWPVWAILPGVFLSLMVGQALTTHRLVEAQDLLPKETDLNSAYQIEGRFLYGWETRWGTAMRLDSVRILSPAEPDFALDRITLYLPAMSEVPSRYGKVTTWMTLKRRRNARPIPWPMQRLRETYMPSFHGSVKSAALIDFEPGPEQGSSALSDGNRELLNAFLAGVPSKIWRDRLQPFGLGHLLAISGLHCIFVYLGIQLLLWPLRRPLFRALLTAMGLIGFAAWVGWSASVTRAATMLMLWHLLPNLNRRREWIRLWCGLLIIGLVSDPLMFLHKGFWYSFAASLGIILGARPRDYSPLNHPWLEPMRKVLPILSAQLFVMPINIMFEGYTTFTSFFWNLLGFMVLIVLLGLLALCVLAKIVPLLVGLVNGLEEGIGYLVGLMPQASPSWEMVRFPAEPWMVLVVLFISILCMIQGQRELRWYMVFVALLTFSMVNRPLSGERLVMLDVGQGLSMLHVDEEGGGRLYDAGGSLPYPLKLERLVRLFGVERMEMAFVSHFDRDHYELLPQGWRGLPLHVPIGQVEEFRAFEDLKEYEVKASKAGDVFEWGSFKGSILWPSEEMRGIPNDNEGSLVILLERGDMSVLLTGDAGKWMEDQLELPELGEHRVLQVGHHGSRTATGQRFVNLVEPDVALISNGRKNRFNHPHPQVMKSLEGVEALQTAEEGTITIYEEE